MDARVRGDLDEHFRPRAPHVVLNQTVRAIATDVKQRAHEEWATLIPCYYVALRAYCVIAQMWVEESARYSRTILACWYFYEIPLLTA